MNNVKKLVRKSYHMELLGTGVYKGLAKQYEKRNSNLSKKFFEFSNHEEMHSRLFRSYYKKSFRSEMEWGKLWLFFGRTLAFTMYLLPLKVKLLRIGAIEKMAVADIEKALEEKGEKEFHEILIKILPDEKAHAGLYREIFKN